MIICLLMYFLFGLACHPTLPLMQAQCHSTLPLMRAQVPFPAHVSDAWVVVKLLSAHQQFAVDHGNSLWLWFCLLLSLVPNANES